MSLMDSSLAPVAAPAPPPPRRIRPAQWLLVAALVLGFWLRFSGLDWDGGSIPEDG